MPGYEHAAMQHTVVALLQPIAKQLGGKVFSEWSIGCGERAWLTPDAMFAFPGFQRAANGHLCPPPPPHLVIEVVSPGQTGLVRKARDYKPYQVPFYWIIDPFEEACYEVLMTTPQITAYSRDSHQCPHRFKTLSPTPKSSHNSNNYFLIHPTHSLQTTYPFPPLSAGPPVDSRQP